MEEREGGRMKKVDYEIVKKVVLSELNKGLNLTILLKNTLLSSPSSSSTLSLVNQILSCFDNSLSAFNPRLREDAKEGMNRPISNTCVEQPRQTNAFEMENVWVTNGVLDQGNVTQASSYLPLYGHDEFAFDPLVWDVLPSSYSQSDRPL